MTEIPRPRPRPDPWGDDPRKVYQSLYQNLRADCAELEEMIAKDSSFTTQDLKRLDKAVTVMKVGFKIMKKALKKSRVNTIETCKTE